MLWFGCTLKTLTRKKTNEKMPFMKWKKLIEQIFHLIESCHKFNRLFAGHKYPKTTQSNLTFCRWHFRVAIYVHHMSDAPAFTEIDKQEKRPFSVVDFRISLIRWTIIRKCHKLQNENDSMKKTTRRNMEKANSNTKKLNSKNHKRKSRLIAFEFIRKIHSSQMERKTNETNWSAFIN